MGKYDVADELFGQIATSGQDPTPEDVTSVLTQGLPVSQNTKPTGAISTITGKPKTELNPEAPSAPSIETLYKANMVRDINTRKKVFAEARGIPLDRYGVKDGEVVFLGDDGQLWSEESSFTNQGFKKFAAGATQPAIVGGTVGAFAGPPGAVGGAMAGETVRQAISGIAMGDPQTAWTNIFSLGAEGLTAFLGELAGAGAIRLANRVLGIGKGNARQITRAAGSDVASTSWREAEKISKIAKDFGIDLNIAQTTKSEQIAAKINFLRDFPPSRDVVLAADEIQREQIAGAIPQFLQETFGGGRSLMGPVETGREIRALAEATVDGLSKRRSAMTRPLYEKAFMDRSKDRIVEYASAIRYKGKVYTGRSHHEAYEKIVKELGEDIFPNDIPNDAHGFVVNGKWSLDPTKEMGQDSFDRVEYSMWNDSKGMFEVPVKGNPNTPPPTVKVLKKVMKEYEDYLDEPWDGMLHRGGPEGLYYSPFVSTAETYADLLGHPGVVVSKTPTTMGRVKRLDVNEELDEIMEKSLTPDEEDITQAVEGYIEYLKKDGKYDSVIIEGMDSPMSEDFPVEIAVLNPDVVFGKAKGATPSPKSAGPTVNVQPVIDFLDSKLLTAKGDMRRALESLRRDFLTPEAEKAARKQRQVTATKGRPVDEITPGPRDPSRTGPGTLSVAEDTTQQVSPLLPPAPRNVMASSATGRVSRPSGNAYADSGLLPPPRKQVLASSVEGDTGMRVPADGEVRYSESGLLPPIPKSDFETSLVGLHQMKTLIDKKLTKGAMTSSDRLIQGELKQIRALLLKQMDEASPAYRTARIVHALLSRGKITTTGRNLEMAEGLTKMIAEVPEKDLANVSSLILAHKNIRDTIVSELRTQILKQPNGEEVWNNAVANYIEHIFDNIPATASDNVGEALANQVFGRPKQQKVLRAAVTPKQFDAIRDFFDVLKRTGITSPRLDSGIKRGTVKNELKKWFESETLTVLTTPLRTPKRMVADRVNALRFGRGSRELAKVLLNPASYRQIKSLKQLPPKSEKMFEALGVFLGLNLFQEGRQQVSSALTPDQPVTPGGSR